MSYRQDLWEVAAERHGVFTISEAEDAGVPAVEVRKLAHRGALKSYGKGVYVHRDVPTTVFTQPAVAVALAGGGAFLHRESVLDLVDLGQFNPPRIQVATRRRVRRALPAWIALETRADVADWDVARHMGISGTTVRRALEDVRNRMPDDRWKALVRQAYRRELIDDREVIELEHRQEHQR